MKFKTGSEDKRMKMVKQMFRLGLILIMSAIFTLGCSDSSGSGSDAPQGLMHGDITGMVELGNWPNFVSGVTAEVEGQPDMYTQVDPGTGRFAFSDIPAGEYDILISGIDSMGQKHKKQIEGVVVVGGNVVDLGRFTLVQTGAISGVIELEDGRNPIGSMIYIPGTNFGAWADETGYFIMLYIPEGTYRLRYDHNGYAPVEFNSLTVVRAQANDVGTVTLLIDSDDDWIADISDNCTFNPNFDQLDTDGDLAGNVCDDDDDNDGLTDLVEGDIGTDPLNPDTDGDLSLDGSDAFALDPTLWLFDTATPEASIVAPIDGNRMTSGDFPVEVYAVDPTGEVGEEISGLNSIVVESIDTLEQWVAVDDGMYPDLEALDGIYTAMVNAAPGSTVSFVAFALDNRGNQAISDAITVSINQAPVAIAGPVQVMYVGDFVQLDASASYDPEGDPITYQWEQTSGPSVNIQGLDTPNPIFMATDMGVLRFLLTVSDGFITSTDIVRVEVFPSCDPAVNAGPIINSPQGDTKPYIERNTGMLYITSRRSGGYGEWDLYSSTMTGGIWQLPVNLGSNINSSSRDEYPFFYENGSKLLFTSDRPGGSGQLDIHKSEFVNGSWTKPTNLGGIINSSYEELDPWLINNGTTLVFTSKRPGIGNFDVWFSTTSDGKNWSEPQLMEGTFNTTSADGNVRFSPDESLAVFASSRPGGYGGWDTYMTLRDGSDWTSAVNMGAEINSPASDGNPFLAEDGTFFFHSNRSGGYGSTDIYISHCELHINEPVADAGVDQQVELSTTATLDGTGSHDPNGDPLIYSWTQVSGWADMPLNDPTIATPSFDAAWVGRYSFKLEVSDGENVAPSDEVEVLVYDPAGDSDSDGLNDMDELSAGTDPFNPDADGDGLNDGAENDAGTDPFDPDTDDDGYNDGDEVATGSDPLDANSIPLGSTECYDGIDNDGDTLTDWPDDSECADVFHTSEIGPDTDGDGLSDAFELEYPLSPFTCMADGNCAAQAGCTVDTNTNNGHSYLFCGQAKSWVQARDFCRSYGGDLTVISGSDEQAWVDSHLSSRAWIGLNDIAEENVFVWSRGSAAIYSNWYNNEPNNAGSGEDCVEILTADYGYTWNDLFCSTSRGFVCEEVGLNPLSVDTDSDGLNDYDEIHTHGTDPIIPDTDGDGLNDGTEIDLGTDPLEIDTDGDGISDGDEVADGTDPLDPCSILLNAALNSIATAAGSWRIYTPDRSVDGNDSSTWNAGSPTSWIMLDFRAVYSIHELRLLRAATPNDSDTHHVYISTDGVNFTLMDTLTGLLDQIWFEKTYASPFEARYLKIESSSSSSWISWREIEAFSLSNSSDGEGSCNTGTDPYDIDTDGDGLSDGEENDLGTNPLDIDTDGDGVSDGDEVAAGTDPLAPDTGDNCSNESGWLFEINPQATLQEDLLTVSWDSATNPCSPPTETTECNDGIDNDGDTLTDFPGDPDCDDLLDTSELGPDVDGDGLSDAFELAYPPNEFTCMADGSCEAQTGCAVDTYNGHNYLFCGDLMTWPDALNYCRQWGGDLTAIGDSAEDAWVDSKWNDYAFIGLNDRNVEGSFVWSHGTPVTYTDWNAGEPNSGGNWRSEDCARNHTSTTSQWNDSHCTYEPSSFICEDGFNLNPHDSDSDGDGLNDYDEINVYGTHPNVSDTDGDGLNDGAENDLGTDPFDPDTDDDGYNDGDEVAAGSDPLDPNSIPFGATECYDGIDNDGDTLTDWPDDPECSNINDMDENQNNFAMSFDGVDDYIQVPHSSSLNLNYGATFEAWVKLNSCAGAPILSKRRGNDSGWEDKALHVESGCKGSVYFYNIMSGRRLISSNPLPLYEWAHVAGVYNGSSVNLYINGQLVGTRAVSGNIADDIDRLFIASTKYSGGYVYLNALIDEVRYWNVARTQQEIQDNMYFELNGDEPGLMGYWKFNEAAGQVAIDSSGNGNHGMLGNNAGADSADPVWVTDTPIP